MKVKKFKELERINEFHHETVYSKEIYDLVLTDISNNGNTFDTVNNLTYNINKYIKDNIESIYKEIKNN